MIDFYKNGKEFKNSLPKPKNTEGVIWAHSLACFTYDPVENFQKILTILGSKREIAVSKVGELDENYILGKCGLYITGECTLLSICDHSSIDLPSGERVPGVCAKEFFVEDYNEIKTKGEYCECYLRPKKIMGFWIYEDLIEDFQDLIKLCEKNKIKVIVKSVPEDINDDDYL